MRVDTNCDINMGSSVWTVLADTCTKTLNLSHLMADHERS